MKTNLIYTAPSMRDLNLASYEGFLTGSVTSEPIKTDEITVKEFVNGFGENEFKDINFD